MRMLYNIKRLSKILIIIFLAISFSWNLSFSKDNPIIVIAPGKTFQSESTVGSAISVIQGDEINSSPEFFLGDILDASLSGMNYFQTGGYGNTSGIQLRGLPKRYSTVYIDGVKMSDPSSPDNSYYISNVMKNAVDRVEILRGSQSSLYGSHAIGGTINIFTKKGNQAKSKKFEISNGSNGTNNLILSYGDANERHDYFIGINSFSTDGISAMNDNDEKDKYQNDGLIANYGYKINDKLKLENSLRYNDSFLNYDTVNVSYGDEDTSTDDTQVSNSLRLIFDNGNSKNTLFYNKYYTRRDTSDYTNKKLHYTGHRDSINFVGEYNFNLDTKIVYGLDNEFDAANYQDDNLSEYLYSDEAIYSQYFDLQFRPFEKLYSTIGLRRDEHTTSEEAFTGRGTLAYKLDENSKIRTSFGTGIRYPALYEYFYGTTYVNKEDLAPELSKSFDVGYQSSIEKANLNFDITAFRITYDDALEGWSNHNDGGNLAWGYGVTNAGAKIVSKGIELATKWKPKKDLSFGLNYNYNDTYDGADCDDPNIGSNCIDTAMVRVPRHLVTSSINYSHNEKLKNTFLIKHSSEVRDYGNVNNSWADKILGAYTTVDYHGSYKLFNTYDLYFSAKNIFDESYEQAWMYSGKKRSFNFGLKRIY